MGSGMPELIKKTRNGRARPLFSSVAMLVCGAVALAGCVSSGAKDPVADLLTPDAQSVAQAKGQQPYDDSLQTAASPSPEYQTAANAAPQANGTPPSPTDPAQPQTGVAGAVMQATGINANRASIFSLGAPPVAAGPAGGQPTPDAAAPPPAAGGFNATSSSVFSSSGKNPLLSSSIAGEKPDSSAVTAYIGDDDIPLIMRGKLYSSSDLGPDPNDTASDMVKLASLPSLTRQSLSGLIVQNPRVETACFKPKLVSMLHDAERHFGKKIVVTSGFRDPEHNLAVGGAKHSMHLSCDAADIQMVGISKWDLAAYFRSRPDIGGVGTYCSTSSIHVDIGARRDWNWKCRPDTEL